MRIKTAGLLAAATAGILLSVGAVKANTIQAIESSFAPSGANFTYTYSVQLTPNNGLTGAADANQSALVILDFPGLISASLSSSAGDTTGTAAWSVGVATGGGLAGSGLSLINTSWSPNTFVVTGFSVFTGTDSPSVNNLVLVYTGALINPVGVQTNLIHLTVTSNVALITTLQSVSRDSALNGSNPKLNEIDTFPVVASTQVVPLPAAVWAGLSTLGGMGCMGMMRKRKV